MFKLNTRTTVEWFIKENGVETIYPTAESCAFDAKRLARSMYKRTTFNYGAFKRVLVAHENPNPILGQKVKVAIEESMMVKV